MCLGLTVNLFMILFVVKAVKKNSWLTFLVFLSLITWYFTGLPRSKVELLSGSIREGPLQKLSTNKTILC